MKHWFRQTDWLDGLFMRRKDEWFAWMSETKSAEFKAEVIEAYSDEGLEYVVPPYFRDMAIERMNRCVPLAFGKLIQSFDIDVDYRPIWWFDPEYPDSLWLSISENFPALFWVSVAPDDAAISSAIAGNLAEVSKPLNEFRGHTRLFAGTHQELQMELENFENHYVMTPPCSAHMWGSEFEYDPWPDSSREWTQTDKIIEFRRNMLQRPGRVPRTSFRTTFSRSVLTVEDHDGAFVFDLRYSPQPASKHVLALSDTIGADYPADAPADLLAAILGFKNITKTMLVGTIDSGDFDYFWSDLLTLRVLITNPLEFELLLKKWVTTDDVDARAKMTSMAHSCMFDAFLYERWVAETDPEILTWLETTLGPKVTQ